MKLKLGFFDLQKRFDKLGDGGGALERIDAVVEWARFCADLGRIDGNEPKSAAGRAPMDRVRMRVEPVCAAMTRMGGMLVRSIGLERVRAWSTMKALTYNVKRLEALNRMGKVPIGGIGVPG